jgi:restriction system protein
MSIPDYQSLMLPILRVLADRKAHSVARVRERIASELKLSPRELAERLASDTTTVFINRIGWAVQYLKAAGAIRAVKRGTYEVTERGLSLLKEHPSEINVRTLRQFPEFVNFHAKDSATVRPPPAPLSQLRRRQPPKNRLNSTTRFLERRWRMNFWIRSRADLLLLSKGLWWTF